MKIILLFFLPLSAFLASCSSTPAVRIQQNPTLFNPLSTQHKKLVSQGKIAKGMTQPTVFLAMGNPSSKSAGEQHGKSFERWNYSEYVPVYSDGFSPYYGSNYGHRYGYNGGCGRYGISPSVHYHPRHATSVHFRHGKVTGWDRVRRNY